VALDPSLRIRSAPRPRLGSGREGRPRFRVGSGSSITYPAKSYFGRRLNPPCACGPAALANRRFVHHANFIWRHYAAASDGQLRPADAYIRAYSTRRQPPLPGDWDSCGLCAGPRPAPDSDRRLQPRARRRGTAEDVPPSSAAANPTSGRSSSARPTRGRSTTLSRCRPTAATHSRAFSYTLATSSDTRSASARGLRTNGVPYGLDWDDPSYDRGPSSFPGARQTSSPQLGSPAGCRATTYDAPERAPFYGPIGFNIRNRKYTSCSMTAAAELKNRLLEQPVLGGLDSLLHITAVALPAPTRATSGATHVGARSSIPDLAAHSVSSWPCALAPCGLETSTCSSREIRGAVGPVRSRTPPRRRVHWPHHSGTVTTPRAGCLGVKFVFSSQHSALGAR